MLPAQRCRSSMRCGGHAILFLSLLATACRDGTSSTTPTVDSRTVDTTKGTDGGGSANPNGDGGTSRSRLAVCLDRAFTPDPPKGWRHTTSSLIVQLGHPGHSAQDVVAVTGLDGAVLQGKFAYGTVSKDLQDEDVAVYLDDCQGWKSLGVHATNSDGRIAVPLSSSLATGIYDVRLVVLGDATVTESRVFVLPSGSRITVFDIDGTMTTSDGEVAKDVIVDFFRPIYSGEYVPIAYPGAVELTTAHRSRGWMVLFVTGRPYWLTAVTRQWLRDLHFATGMLHVTDTNAEAAPTVEGVGNFKLSFLRKLTTAGFRVDLAYGNATTDIYAYLNAGIAPSSVWIIGENGGKEGTNAATDSWQARATEVSTMPTIEQPFDWQ
ncbi:MAG: hypothetical protein V2A73_12735 [Pseudomonadota bacterium]